MSTEDRCGFCQRLPALSGRGRRVGVVGRCPVCKGWLIRTANQTYRDDGVSSNTERRPRHPIAPGALTLGCLATLAAVGGLFVTAALRDITPPTRPITQSRARVAELKPAPTPVVEEVRLPEEAPAPRGEESPAPAPERIAVEPPKPAPVRPASASVPVPGETVLTVSPKPAAPPVTVPAVPPSEPDPGPVAPVAPARDGPPPWADSDTNEKLAELLQRVPELHLAVPLGPGGSRTETGVVQRVAWQHLEQTVLEEREKFLDNLLAKRPKLAGLPFLNRKDCQLEPAAAKALEVSSRQIRGRLALLLGTPVRGRQPDPELPASAAATTFKVYHELVGHLDLRSLSVSPALEQILTGEPAPVRLALVQFFRSPPDSPVVAAALARRAVFDPSAEVRLEAVTALRYRPAGDYLPILLNGLRYPWPPANYHAAEALVALDAKAAVADLLKILDGPDPCGPFETEGDDRFVPAVRELVRLNHHGSCLLCHAPSFAKDDPVPGPVPNPLAPLPPVTRYYSESRGGGRLFVRADITYLRQDFSEVLPVENPGPWPKQQRFDFLVRVRRLTEEEAQARRERLACPAPLPAFRQATAFALRQLTNLDGGFTAASWEEALCEAGWPLGLK